MKLLLCTCFPSISPDMLNTPHTVDYISKTGSRIPTAHHFNSSTICQTHVVLSHDLCVLFQWASTRLYCLLFTLSLSFISLCLSLLCLLRSSSREQLCKEVSGCWWSVCTGSGAVVVFFTRHECERDWQASVFVTVAKHVAREGSANSGPVTLPAAGVFPEFPECS